MRGQLHAEVQPGEILPHLRQENAPPPGGRAAEEKIPSAPYINLKNPGDIGLIRQPYYDIIRQNLVCFMATIDKQ